MPDNGLTVGDAFVGGLYLSKDNTLIIQYPAGYMVSAAEPAPDQQGSNALVWYGIRSFGVGEPNIVLEKTAFPLIPVVAGFVIIVIAVAGLDVSTGEKNTIRPRFRVRRYTGRAG